MSKKKETLLFADVAVESLEINKTLPAKFERMLKKKKTSRKSKG